VVYELYYKPGQTHDSTKEAELQARLAKLESIVGNVEQSGACSSLLLSSCPLHLTCVNTNKKKTMQLIGRNLTDHIEELEDKLRSMTPEKIDVIKKKVKELNTDLDKVTDPKKHSPSAETERRVTELLEKTEKWDHVAHAIPTLVERLRSLKQLHQEAAAFSDTLGQVSSEQGVIAEALATQDQLLKTVRAKTRLAAYLVSCLSFSST